MDFGYRRKRARINLSDGKVKIEDLSDDFLMNYIGGRGFNMRVLYDEIGPEVDPLSSENKLIVGVGPLNGTLFPGSARVNFSAKSPQTGILGDSNAGGFFGSELKFAGFDQIIIEGKSLRPVYIFINDGKIELRSAEHLAGKDVFETNEILIKELKDQRIQIAAVGPAAENGVKFSGIFCNLVRAAARTGMGTVLASKNVKAIVVRGTLDLGAKEPEKFLQMIDRINQQIFSHSEYIPRKRMGTTRLISVLNSLGCLATKHYQTGRFEYANLVSGEYLEKNYKKKSKSCFSCTIPCSRFFEINSDKYQLKSEGPEFEGLAGFSSKLGINNIEDTLKCVDMCNRYGLDVITTSECIAFSMELYERGIVNKKEVDNLELIWGNVEAVQTLIRKIAYREGFGDVLADGALAAARKIGRGSEKYVMHVKGLEIFKADPRGIKGYALGNAVSTRGGDHLRSEPSFEFTQDREEAIRRFGVPEAAFRLEYKGKGKVVKFYEERCVLADSLNACKNTITNMEILSYSEAAELLNYLTGLQFTESGIQKACERIYNVERSYIVREGIRRKDDTLPERFLKEPLPEGSGPSTGSVVELEPMLDEYYSERNWDPETGIPFEEKLLELGLSDIVNDLKIRGIEIKKSQGVI
jgi:aldehyde:ferredoxin oxidoreductase